MTRPNCERSLARASIYRLLSLGFSWPTEALWEAVEPARVGAGLLGPTIAAAVEQTAAALRRRTLAQLQEEHRQRFSLSASPDSPLSECAYSAKHVFQEVQELADIAGFYRAFGVEVSGQRPDDLAVELEFCYLMSLKDAYAREQRLPELRRASEDGLRAFLHDHLGRWAENIGRRLEVLAAGTAYESLGRLLREFVASEVEYMRVGPITPHQEIPRPPEPLDEEGCPAENAPLSTQFSREDILAELTPVQAPAGRV